MTVEGLRSTIIEQFTPERWARMKQRGQLKISGLGLNAIATRFGVEGNPIGNHAVHLELGKAIWGEHAAFEPKEVTAQALREALTAQFTPEQWAGMNRSKKQGLKISGLGLVAIATRLGVEGDPVGYHAVHLALGKAIWGEQPAFVEVTADGLRETITQHLTPEQWTKMTAKTKRQLKISGLGLNAIARRFGIEGDPANNHPVHLELGKAIWGEEWPQ